MELLAQSETLPESSGFIPHPARRGREAQERLGVVSVSRYVLQCCSAAVLKSFFLLIGSDTLYLHFLLVQFVLVEEPKVPSI